MGQSKFPKEIPLHEGRLNNHAGFKLKNLSGTNEHSKNKPSVQEAHRDDHYMFIFQEKGYSQFTLDFETVKLEGPHLVYILPGQVHQYSKQETATGWLLAIDASFIDNEKRALFENRSPYEQAIPVPDTAVFCQAFQLLSNLSAQKTGDFSRHVARDFAKVIISMMAELFTQHGWSGNKITSRPLCLTNDFKKLVNQQYKHLKTPALYAERLHVSASYLNEVVKNITGFPASYWIQQEIMLEAKRLLCYTDEDVKQIAYNLGYEDHAYFSRIFKKSEKITPLAFRKRYRESSNHHR